MTRKHHRRTLQRKMAGRNILQRYKAAIAHQIFCKYKPKCSDDTNMDSTNHYTHPKDTQAMAKHRWYLSNLVAFIGRNLFVKVNLQKCIDRPFQKAHPLKENKTQGILF